MRYKSNGVTKKTAAKKTVQKKTVTPAVDVSEMTELSPVSAPATAVTTITATTETVNKTATKETVTVKSIAAENPVSLKQIATVSPEVRQKMIEDAAYFKAEKRNFTPGHEAQDWADAECEIDDLINRAKTMTGH